MNQEKDETIGMDEEVSRRESFLSLLNYPCRVIDLQWTRFAFRIKMLVWQVKQRRIAGRINIRIKPMMMKKKMNLSISNQVHVHGGKNDVKLFVFCSNEFEYWDRSLFARLLNVIFPALMHRTSQWIQKKEWKSFGMKFYFPKGKLVICNM